MTRDPIGCLEAIAGTLAHDSTTWLYLCKISNPQLPAHFPRVSLFPFLTLWVWWCVIPVQLWGKQSWQPSTQRKIAGCLGDLLDQRVHEFFLQLLHCQIALQNGSINLHSDNMLNGLYRNCLFIYLFFSLGCKLFKDFLISQCPMLIIYPDAG